MSGLAIPGLAPAPPRIVHLKGYVFFSSCVSIVRQIEEKFQHEDKHQVGFGIPQHHWGFAWNKLNIGVLTRFVH